MMRVTMQQTHSWKRHGSETTQSRNELRKQKGGHEVARLTDINGNRRGDTDVGK